MKTKLNNTIIAIILFSIAMASLESAVVVYLRALYYADGFVFPMKIIPSHIGIIEISREFATLMMLAGIGYLSGFDSKSRWGWFMIAFGIWDIFYYVFLYVFIGWPVSLSDMDILFLIPLPWFGPVYAPCLVSIALIVYGALKIYDTRQDFPTESSLLVRILFLMSCVIILSSFTFPLIQYSIDNKMSLEAAATSFDPSFNELIFFLGYGVMCASLLIYWYKISQSIKIVRTPAYF